MELLVELSLINHVIERKSALVTYLSRAANKVNTIFRHVVLASRAFKLSSAPEPDTCAGRQFWIHDRGCSPYASLRRP